MTLFLFLSSTIQARAWALLSILNQTARLPGQPFARLLGKDGRTYPRLLKFSTKLVL